MGTISIQESATFLVALMNLLTAFYILVKNIRGRINQTFFLFGAGVALWAGSISAVYFTHNIFFSQLSLFGGLLAVYGLVLFASAFPDAKPPAWVFWILTLPFAAVSAAIPLRLFISAIRLGPDGEPVPVNGQFFYYYVAVLAIYILLAFVILYRRYVVMSPAARLQVQYMLLGAALFMGTALVADAFLPAMGIFGLNLAGPIASIFFIALTGYALVWRHLFSVKMIATEIFALSLNLLILSRIIIAKDILSVVGNLVVFVATIIFSIFLIRSVRQEIRHREELENLTIQLQAANERLTELSRFKTQILSVASHQIKSPLAVTKGFIALLEEGLYGSLNPKVKAVIGKIRISTEQLIGLVNTMLDLRKVEEGRMDYNFEPMDLGRVVGDMVDGLRPLAEERRLNLKYDPPSAPIMVSGDQSKLPEVFRNLIDNALKYTPLGKVFVEVRLKDERAEVVVKDTGIGMSKDLMPKLFEEFVRDERIKKEIQGTGFGLYIAKKIVEAHGGTLTAESPGQGKGSTFTVILPAAK